MIGHHQSVGQHLEGVECRIDHDFRLGHLPLDGVRKAKEERVAGSEDHHLIVILPKDGIQRHRDVYPFCIICQQRFHNLVVALASGKDLALLDNLHDLWWKPRVWIVRDTYYDKTRLLHIEIIASSSLRR